MLEQALVGLRVVTVAAGSYHSGAVTKDGVAFMWGENSSCQCAIEGQRQVATPTMVTISDPETSPPELTRVVQLACGELHTLALSSKGEVWSWGSGCQLGLVATTFPVAKPQKLEHLAGRTVVQIAAGAHHCLVLVQRPSPHQMRQSSEKCHHCHQLLLTMTDREDHVIISDSHYCPLGVVLSEPDPRPSHPDPQDQTPSLPPNQTAESHMELPHMEQPEYLPHAVNQMEPAQHPRQAEQSGAPDSHLEPNGTVNNLKPRSSQFPDEKAVQDYLRKLSDNSQQDDPVKSTPLPCTQHSSEEEDIRPASPSSSSPSAFNTLVVSCASVVGERVAATYEALSLRKVVNYYYQSPNLPDSIGSSTASDVSQHKETREERMKTEESMPDKKSFSLGDIREQGSDGMCRRLSLPGLLSQGTQN